MRYLDMTPRYGLVAASTCGVVTIMAVLASCMHALAVRMSEAWNSTLPTLVETFGNGSIMTIWAIAMIGLAICFTKENKAASLPIAICLALAAAVALGVLFAGSLIAAFTHPFILT